MLNSRSTQIIIVLIVALFLAVWLGYSIVTNQIETVLQVIAAVIIITCLALGRRVWLLIPFAAALGLRLKIPGDPSALLLAQALVLGFSGLLFLMRKLPYRLALTEMEIWLILITLLVVQVYMRNPVGVNLFGGSTVGGKGYALYAIALCSAVLLAGLKVQVADLKLIIPLSILGVGMNTVIAALGYFVPVVGYYTGGAKETNSEGNVERNVDTGAATRVGILLNPAIGLSLFISSYISPLRACFRPLWAPLVLLAIGCATFSGFRNGIATVGLTFLLGIAYRSGFTGVIFSMFGGACGVALLAVVNTLHPLPPNIQRSLSFLPGTWEQRYIEDTVGSSEWRFEIWREVLFTDRWIQNKLLGDGLGFTAAELAAQMTWREGVRSGVSGFDPFRDKILSNGDYHSGPVSTVRVIGYVGMIVFLLAQLRLAVHGHRQILRCRGTEWYPLSLYIGIPLITSPLIFVFLFGDFKSGASTFLLSLGMCRLLENNLPLPAYVKPRRMPFVLQHGKIPDGRNRNLANERAS